MTTLPIVERELRVASRKGWTFWGRSLVALVALLVMAWLLLTVGARGNSAGTASAVFGSLSTLAFGYCLFAGAWFSADSFARERREETLGLLFLTHLRAWDIALGKLTATSLGAVYCLLAVLPALAIPLLMGGITGLEYTRVVAVLLATLWQSLTLGLLASTLTPDPRGSATWAVVLMLAISLVAPLLGLVVHRWLGLPGGTSQFMAAIDWASAFTGFGLASSLDPESTRRYGYSLGYLGATGAGALALAIFRLSRMAVAGEPETVKARPLKLAMNGTPGAERVSTPLGVSRPEPGSEGHGVIAWLSLRLRFRRWVPWVYLGISGGSTLLLIWLIDESKATLPLCFLGSFFGHFLLKLALAVEAPRVFHEARRTGAMELLLTTALSDAEFVGGRVRALWAVYGVPLGLMTLADLAWLMATLRELRGDSEASLIVMVAIGRLLILWMDAAALAWTGTWVGVSTPGTRAAIGTWVRVVVPPYLIWMLGILVVALGEVLLPGGWRFAGFVGERSGLVWLIILTVVANLAVSGTWRVLSARWLNRGFRHRASQPLGHGRGF